MTNSKPVQKFGLTEKKEKNFGEWYQQLVIRSELLDYYDVSGCYIMRPSCMYVWNVIRNFFTAEIEKRGVKECYFPMLVRKSAIEKEKAHIDNFEPELAWITKCGNTEIEPVALRPTSESIMYPSFSKWLRSYRDLPFKCNQWCNVIRWEVKSTTPLIRGREFLWQEGHTVHLKTDEAEEEVKAILDIYERLYRELLAIPVIKGRKTENEKFGGAEYTLTVEAFIPGNGRAVQAATSHHLGDHFARMYDVKVADLYEKETFVFQSSWGITTRSIGIAAMIHSDNRGLVLPPHVAEVQVVIIPCGVDNNNATSHISKYIQEIFTDLKKDGIRVELDDRTNVSPGYKFNHWELRGVPIRLEIGPRDFAKNEICLVSRHNFKKQQISKTGLITSIKEALSRMHDELYTSALEERDKHLIRVYNWDTFMKALNSKNIVLALWCGNSECEMEIRKRSEVVVDGESFMGAKSLCIPFDFNKEELEKEKICVNCNKKAVCWCLFGRSY